MISDPVWDDDYKEVRGVVPEGSGLGAPNTRSAALRERESGWLLTQPHGLEGILGSLVHADCRDLAVANRPDVPVNAAFDCGAAAATTPRHSHESEDQVVANLLEALDLDLDFAQASANSRAHR